jgi:aspartate aminotransferase
MLQQGNRIGSPSVSDLFSIVTTATEEKKRVDSHVKIVVRPMYSNTPICAARILSEVLDNPTWNKQWLDEVKGMADILE